MFSFVHWLVNRHDRGVSCVIAAVALVGGARKAPYECANACAVHRYDVT